MLVVIDDAPVVLDLWRCLVDKNRQTQHFDLECFTGSASALSFVQVHGPRVRAVFLDYELEGETGADVLQLLQPLCPNAAFTLLSGKVGSIDRETLNKFSRVIAKPAAISVLQAAMASDLGRGETQDDTP